MSGTRASSGGRATRRWTGSALPGWATPCSCCGACSAWSAAAMRARSSSSTRWMRPRFSAGPDTPCRSHALFAPAPVVWRKQATERTRPDPARSPDRPPRRVRRPELRRRRGPGTTWPARPWSRGRARWRPSRLPTRATPGWWTMAKACPSACWGCRPSGATRWPPRPVLRNGVPVGYVQSDHGGQRGAVVQHLRELPRRRGGPPVRASGWRRCGMHGSTAFSIEPYQLGAATTRRWTRAPGGSIARLGFFVPRDAALPHAGRYGEQKGSARRPSHRSSRNAGTAGAGATCSSTPTRAGRAPADGPERVSGLTAARRCPSLGGATARPRWEAIARGGAVAVDAAARPSRASSARPGWRFAGCAGHAPGAHDYRQLVKLARAKAARSGRLCAGVVRTGALGASLARVGAAERRCRGPRRAAERRLNGSACLRPAPAPTRSRPAGCWRQRGSAGTTASGPRISCTSPR